jgi:proline iminopeptidase
MKYLLTSALLLTALNTGFTQGVERLLKVNNTEINVRVVGRGSPILIVHGGPGLNHTYFLPHLIKLANEHQLIFIDQRACGKSSGTLDSTQMSFNWLVNDMEAIRQQLKLGKVSILAHSWGTLLGLLYGVCYPENIRYLIIANSVSPKSGEYDQRTNEIINSRYSKADSMLRDQTLRSQAFERGDVEAYNLLIKLSFKQTFYNELYIDSLNLMLPSDFLQKRNVLFFMSKELSAYDFYPQLKKIKCRTLIIHGDYDAIPVELSQKINHAIFHSKLLVIKNAGHFPFIEQSEKFVSAVNKFLNGK